MTQPSDSATKVLTLPRKPIRRKRGAEEVAAEIVEDAVQEKKPRTGRKRQATPENADSVEIVSAVVTMSDLCRDLRTGKTSQREMELRSMDWAEVARKKKEREDRKNNKGNGAQTAKKDASDTPKPPDKPQIRPQSTGVAGPQMRIVNGEIVLDTTSLQIDRHADAARNGEAMEEVEENPLTRRINAASFGKRTKVEVWDEEMNELFYKGLRMFGTDFMMISKMFPGRTRRHIKLKFSNEERRNPERIKSTLLGPPEPVDLDSYSEMTNTVYDDPKAIQRELDEERRRIESEHAAEQIARHEMLHNPGGRPQDSNVIPSIETDSHGKPRQSKKGKKKDELAKFAGGTEEILGSVDDF
ncbi:Transcription factor TFIIIB component B [Myotisia sp. PD_48]|nr:Transcription factor TFIIIB component B [Myotisia sp. PD_48]